MISKRRSIIKRSRNIVHGKIILVSGNLAARVYGYPTARKAMYLPVNINQDIKLSHFVYDQLI